MEGRAACLEVEAVRCGAVEEWRRSEAAAARKRAGGSEKCGVGRWQREAEGLEGGERARRERRVE